MRPCNRCGEPLENSEDVCEPCLAYFKTRPSVPDISRIKPSTISSVRNSSIAEVALRWLASMIGYALLGIPAAVLVMVATQVVTGFRFPMSITCYVGIAIVVSFAVIGKLTDFIPPNKTRSD